MVPWSQKGTTPDRQETPMTYTFKGTPSQLRAMYEHGKSIKQIMDETGKDYATVQRELRAARTPLRAGGLGRKCKHAE